MKIINLTQHNATPEQQAQGVIELDEKRKERLKELLTFEDLPLPAEIKERAREIKKLVIDFMREKKLPKGEVGFMIGGAPFLMSALERELADLGKVLYAFSKRVVEEKEIDGKVVKTSIFKHIGFVEPPNEENIKLSIYKNKDNDMLNDI